MKKSLSIFIIAIGAASCPISFGPALADNYECQSAVSSFNSAVDDISSTSHRYLNCVSNSRGHDDCSFEFRRLKSAQDDFESTVSSYGISCREY